ncbi:leptin-like [Poeciliopsis prolifica]|uniref:leptin-like n=1 Tax=Poeciliopsis prolifica TaxID=188132 RepID=UPI00241340E4|nr:leptin-like [Poeciliopsis prolifica]
MFFSIQKSTIMDSTLVALVFLFHVLSVGTGKPLPDAKINIQPIIKTLMVRLNAFQALPSLGVNPPEELEGFSSIVATMNGYNDLISENLLNVAQVKTDISRLTDTINRKLMNCTEKNPKLTLPVHLQQLQNEWEQDPERHVEAVSLAALNGVREILKLLQNQIDGIASC